MGSAGHAFISHTKALSPAAQSKDGGYGSPPHPLEIRPGQRFWPRTAPKRRAFVVRTIRKEYVHGKRLDGAGEPVRVSLARLLERRDDGQGRHYQLLGYSPRRYRTYACVMEVDEKLTVLCVPEWHPTRAVQVFSSLVPRESRRPGAWVELRCDLAAPTPARLQVSNLSAAEDPGPAKLPRPSLERPRPPRSRSNGSIRYRNG